ncbi:putrescine-binding periplasmic protein [Youhaiella tibetensis]|uniref:Putrescine-binding periplasmic protein n=1 Tax=Paradevosia tibetensis TaxID=1447062 RepID=A0A5B9DV47_9HYPH|nr:polyamine ABC transporter substrate-binding protein [Youhaiella tibetensis]AKR57385.1 spermidine/putrescine ABC transportersubstrate-binding protein [Devosia sp. H5989]QEE22318.1 polyamine ABC transporter substrate-binding protein [Youhaiella tibetensis]GGF43307.1 putrescine-binding periplasmic protein [Youhaiella tibetensis]
MKNSLILALGALMVAAPALNAPVLAQENVVNVYNWSDYIAEDTIAKFEAETGIKVNYDVYDNNEIVDAKLLAGNSGYDIVVPSGSFLQRQVKAGLLLPLDKSKLPNLVNMDPAIMQAATQFDPDNAHSVPYMINTIGLGYNVAKATAALGEGAALDSWDLLFKPENAEKLASCGIAVLDSPSEVMGIALHYLGLDPNSENEEDLAKAEALMTSIKPYIRYFHSSQYIDDLGNGEICLALGYSGDVFIAADAAKQAGQGVEINYIIPKEGAATLFDFLAVPADAPHPENAMKFINFIMEPEIVAAITNYVFYANPNVKSLPFVDDEVKNNPGIYPSPEVLAKAFVMTAHSPDYEELLTRTWTRIKTGQ